MKHLLATRERVLQYPYGLPQLRRLSPGLRRLRLHEHNLRAKKLSLGNCVAQSMHNGSEGNENVDDGGVEVQLRHLCGQLRF